MKTTEVREEIIVPRAIEREWRRSIKKGMEFLDGYFERKDWVNDIDIDSLDLNDESMCVAGQLFATHADAEAEGIWADSGYGWAIKYVVEHEPWAQSQRRLDSEVAKQLGFYTPTEPDPYDERYEGHDPVEVRVAKRNGVDIGYLWDNDCTHWQLFTREWERELKKRKERLDNA